MSTEEKIEVGIKITAIKTLKFLINNTDEASKTDRSNFQFNISLATYISMEKKTIGFDVILDLFIDKEMKNHVAEFISRIDYSIINFENVVIKKEKEIVIADSVMMTLISIALSTARGMFASKIEGSALEGVYLPILNPSNFKPINKNLTDEQPHP